MANLALMAIGLERLVSGLRRRSLQIGDHRVVYSEGGKGTATKALPRLS